MIYRRYFKQYPKMIECLDRRHIVYNDTLKLVLQLEQEGKALVIAPEKPLEIGRFEKRRDKLTALYEEGYREAAQIRKKIFAFLE